MNRKELLDYYDIKPLSIKQQGAVSIITDDEKKYVLKKRVRKADIFDYLTSRNFSHFPKIYSTIEDEYDLVDYIPNMQTPKEQTLQDIIYLDSLLHAKTTFYKNVDDDYIKSIYEESLTKIDYIYKYYNELQDMIELEVYMSPSHYLLIRNVSMIYVSLRKSRDYIEKWYSVIKTKKRMRYAFIHGNLEEDHLIQNDNLYFISWDQARIDLPIYDVETFYRKSYLDITLDEILDIYRSKYPLEEEEMNLFFSLILIPDKIDMTRDEYMKTKQVTEIVFYLHRLLTYLKNNTKKSHQQTQH